MQIDTQLIIMNINSQLVVDVLISNNNTLYAITLYLY